MKYKKGHKFYGPDGQGYELTRDVQNMDIFSFHDLNPFGGAPVPEPYAKIPEFMWEPLGVKSAQAINPDSV